MKNKLILTFILLIYSVISFAQTDKGFAIVYGKSTGGLTPSIIRTGFLMGTGSHKLNQSNSFGIRHFSTFSNKERMGYEIGVNYLKAQVIFRSDADPNLDPEIRDYINLSIPIYMNHSFWKYFYFNYGILADYQIYNEEPLIGFGLGFGLGATYDINNFFIYLNPKYEKHLFLHEELGLLEFGLMLGLGYKF